MYSIKAVLSVTALAGISLSQSFDGQACFESESSLFANAPTMPAALASYTGDSTETAPPATTTSFDNPLGDPEVYVEFICGMLAGLPSSLLPDFQSYGSALLSYGSVHISEYDAYITDCVTTGEEASTRISYLNSILTGTGNLCQPTLAPGGVSNSSYPTTPAPTATSSNASSNSSTTMIVTAAAAKPTGAFAGAAAMGGFLGAAALL
ncbi:hypothetical protein GGR58DRAFT_492182 [Xylaria digitata]|nr:hypothetical protein GGR58DRAFT_492182 [Xylaria digitata]